MTTHNPKLVSTELALLWTTYIQDSMAKCIIKHFYLTKTDPDLDPILSYADQCSTQHLNQITELFNKEKIPVPKGFSDKDLHENAPKLFPENYMYRFLEHMSRSGLTNYAFGRSTSYRKDVRQLADEWLKQSSHLYNLVIDKATSKGILVRSPDMAYPTEVEFVQKAGLFSNGFLDKGRPLLGVEIAHIGTNIEANYTVSTTLLGYSQVAEDPKVKQIMYRGHQIAKKHAEIFSSILRQESVHAPSDWDSSLTSSTSPTFSDALMLTSVASMISIGISNYGTAIGASLRKDLGVHYTRLLAELGQYAEDLTELMIENQWLEKPPQILNRKELVKGE
ncbi:hypothetical protein GCM10008967_37400 [Bacillus carboniphilus]|uniref:DUF3231 family protein n=1 Tax=Bacillus carboniphilus TaxID=86663 RepID=A0ABN0WPH3_9BACI